jgi:hypothetical protein
MGWRSRRRRRRCMGRVSEPIKSVGRQSKRRRGCSLDNSRDERLGRLDGSMEQ